MSELSTQRHAELEEEFYEEWHPEQGTNMLDMLVHKIIGLEKEIELRDDGKATALLVHTLVEKGWKSPEEAAQLKEAIGFFCSVIKAGEPWTYVCQEKYDALFTGEDDES